MYITTSNNCKTLTVSIPEADIDASITPATYSVVTHKNASAETGSATIADGKLEFTVTTTNSFVGVITLTIIQDPQNTQTFYSVGSCDLDCCIAGLIEKSINCDSSCDDCDAFIRRADRINLFLKSSLYAAELESNVEDAIEKYAKAEEMCNENCPCGC